MVTNSEQLRDKIAWICEPLLSGSAAFWNHPRLTEMFPEFLIAMHGAVRATVHSLESAAEYARKLEGSDPVAAGLAEYYSRHALEEKRHDEWLLDDIAALGIDRADVLKRMPSRAVAALVGSQYYWMYHYHPIAFMGHIAIMEDPVGSDYYDDLISRTGLPRAAFGTQFLHAQLDPKHVRDFNHVLDSLPITTEQAGTIGTSAFTSAYWICQMYEELIDSLNSDRSVVKVAVTAS